MTIDGWYYLHINGDLIYKREFGDTAADLRETPFAVMLWPFDPEDREGAWRIVVEALSCGATPRRVKDLAEKWYCDDKDAQVYAEHIGVNHSNGWRSMARRGRAFYQSSRISCRIWGYCT